MESGNYDFGNCSYNDKQSIKDQVNGDKIDILGRGVTRFKGGANNCTHAKNVNHLIRPRRQGDDQGKPELLSACNRNNLAPPNDYVFNFITIISIIKGSYRSSLEEATCFAITGIKTWIKRASSLIKGIFTCCLPKDFALCQTSCMEILD